MANSVVHFCISVAQLKNEICFKIEGSLSYHENDLFLGLQYLTLLDHIF